MSEAVEGIVLEREAKVRPQAEYDHGGTTFKSERMDEQVGLFRDKIAEDYKITPIDAVDIVRAEIEDHDAQKKNVIVGRKEFLREENRLEDVRETFVNAYVGHEISPTQKGKIETYFDTRIAWYEHLMETGDETERTTAEANKDALTILKNKLLNPEAEREAALELDGDTDKADTEATEAEAQLEVPEIFPEYTYVPNVDKILEGLRDKDRDITFDDLPKIYERFEADLQEQETAYIVANPGWKEKKEAVGAANMKFDKRIREIMKDGTEYADAMDQIKDAFIYASYNEARGASASWEALPKKGGTEYYTFSLDPATGAPNEANYFGTHLKDARKFESWREGIHGAQKSLKAVTEDADTQLDFEQSHALFNYIDMCRAAIFDKGDGEDGKDGVDIIDTNDLMKLNQVLDILHAKVPIGEYLD